MGTTLQCNFVNPERMTLLRAVYNIYIIVHVMICPGSNIELGVCSLLFQLFHSKLIESVINVNVK